ncbi:MAG: hypothetical protein Rhirs2KO_05900 [Rhizobiaceae bacterium]
MTDAVMPRLGQLYALRRHFLTIEGVRNLHQNAGAVAHQRVGTHRPAVSEVFEHLETVLNDPVRLHALHMGYEADTAGIMLVARIVKPDRVRYTAGDTFRGGRRFLSRDRSRHWRWGLCRHHPVLHNAGR